MPKNKMNIAVFASGQGTNFAAIAHAIKKGALKARLCLLVCDNPAAGVLRKARQIRVKTLLVRKEAFPTKAAFERHILRHLKEENIELVVLAGFMRILSATFVRAYKGRILNIHPALLPSFRGAHGIKDAFEFGVKVTGVTVHFVNELVDHGPIFLQEPVIMRKGETLSSLEARIHRLEHKLYPEAIRLFVEGRLKIKGRKVRVITR